MHYLRELIHRLRLGQSDRAISRDLEISRNTIGKYRSLAQKAGLLEAGVCLPDIRSLAALLGPAPAPPRPASSVQPYQEIVERLLAEGVEMTALFERLRMDYGYKGSYSSIRRFVRRLQPAKVRVTVRVQTAPGEEAQVDFSPAGRFLDPSLEGRLRPAHIFVMTLSFSRHQYAELVFDQKIATWIGCHRRALAHFGGVPQRIVLDNLKAAVLVASLHDPVLGEAYRRMAQHYGFVVSPNRPRTPQHKGKVESGVHFIKRNFLAGQQFADIGEANLRLAEWVRERAGVREHGTTHQPPLTLFEQQERAQLLPLPAESFELIDSRQVKVHPDCHVVIAGSYYSVPFRYVGQRLDAFVFERVVQLFAGVELVATHPRAMAKGVWRTRLEHYPSEKAAFLEKTPQYCQARAQQIGPSTSTAVEQLLAERPLDRLRSVQALLRLEEVVGRRRLEAACQRAIYFGDVRYRRIKDILNAALDQMPLPAKSPAQAGSQLFLFARSASEFFGQEKVKC